MIRWLEEGRPKLPDKSERPLAGFEPADRPLRAPEAPPPARRRHRLRSFLLSVIVGLLIAAALAPAVLKAVIRRQLRALTAENLVGELRIGSISFSLPWTVSLTDTSFITRGPAGESIEMFRVPRLMLHLDGSPLSRGATKVAEATIDAPFVHLIQTRDGILGIRPDPTPSSNRKFSDLVLLRHFALTGGQFILEDRTEAGAAPMEWRKIDLALDKSGKLPAEYAYRISGEGGANAGIDSSGSADLDALLLKVDTCNATLLAAGPTRESPLPAVVQTALRHVGAAGELVIHASGAVPLTHVVSSTYSGTIGIRNCALDIAEWQTHFDHVATNFAVASLGDAIHPDLKITSLDARVGDTSLHLEDAPAGLDFARGTWFARIPHAQIDTGTSRQSMAPALHDMLDQWDVHGAVEFSVDASGPLYSGDLTSFKSELHLKPGAYSFHPPTMKTPLDRIADATLTLDRGNLHIHQLRAMCADDIIYLKDATIGLADLPAKFRVSDASGAVTFGARHGVYPPQLQEYVDRYNPNGPFFFSGNFSAQSADGALKPSYEFEVHTPRGRFALLDRRIPVYNVRTQLHLKPGLITIDNFDADAVGGTLRGGGKIISQSEPHYDLQLTAVNMDLRELAQRMATPGHPPAPVSGRARLNVQCNGVIPDNGSVLDQITGSGAFDIREGSFFEIPVIKAIAASVGAPQAAVVSDAGAQFHVGDRKIHFDRALISAPALGVEGTGDVGFDGSLDFHKVTALTGGDWQRNLGQGNPAGEVIGRIQGALNTATRAVWCDLDITGTVNEPVVKATPVPFLSKPMLHVKELLGN